MSNNYQQKLYKQRSTDLANQQRPPFSVKLQQQQRSSHFPTTFNRLGNVTSSTLPTTPQIFQSLINSNTTTKNEDGYDSDSSEEGRKPSPPQIQKLGLRVVNPDNEEEEQQDNIKTPISSIISSTNNGAPLSPPTPNIEVEQKTVKEKLATPVVAPIITTSLNNDQQQQQLPIPSETQWRVYQLRQQPQMKPDLPPHQHLMLRPVISDSYLSRRESKTIAGGDGGTDSASVDTTPTEVMHSYNNIDHTLVQQQQQQQTSQLLLYKQIASPISPVPASSSFLNNSSSSPIITAATEFASPTSPNFSHKSLPAAKATFANTNPSKYAKISYHLTNDPTALKKYRGMAEKTNDTTTQLMFAKYLLETSNAFQQRPTQTVVGSMWGLGSTTNKSQRHEPYLVVPPPSARGEEDVSSPTASSVASSSDPKTSEVGTSRSSTSNYHQQQSLMNVTMKQQASLNIKSAIAANNSASVTSESNDQKRKLLEQEGIKWIVKLAKQNVPEACYMQANWMDKELYGFKGNKVKSIALHHIAAKADIPESVFAIAEHYEQDDKREIESARIVKFYQSAANFGYVNAIYKLAFITIHGSLGIRQSLTEGLNLMYKACTLSSEEFNTPPYTFALMLTNDYEQVDFPQPILEPYGGKEAAILYYERAARLNNDQAQSKLGSIYEHGLYGESMNFARAFDYYEQAAINGNAKAMLGLCRLNNRGSHGPGDQNEATRLENDVSGWLAGTPVNEDLAFSWCEKAAKAGNVDALALLGWFYECGFGQPRDFGRAEKYYELAAEKGDLGAKSRLLKSNKSITKQQHEGITGTSGDKVSANKKKRKNNSSGYVKQQHNSCKCM